MYTFVINHPRPTIAVSALFSVDNHYVKDDVLRVILNVMPVSKYQTFIIFSYREKDSKIARAALDRVLNTTGAYQLYEISRIVLNNCENFVLSPKYVDEWSETKGNTIKDYFIRTLFTSDMEFESEDLFLF